MLNSKQRRELRKHNAKLRQEPVEVTISTGYLRQLIEAERVRRVTPPTGGVTPRLPSEQVETTTGRLEWKAWKAREARLKTEVVTRAKAKRMNDGRSDREIWYQHYKCWGIRGSK